MSEKKKVYVETTVVSDATALPINDLTLVGRQVASRDVRRSALRKCFRRRCGYIAMSDE